MNIDKNCQNHIKVLYQNQILQKPFTNTHLMVNLLRYGHQQMNVKGMALTKGTFLSVAEAKEKQVMAISGVIPHCSQCH